MGGSNGGRYILCDVCGETTFSLNLPWPHDGKTLAAAEDAGWLIKPGRLVFGPSTTREDREGWHVCPECRRAENRAVVPTDARPS